MSYTIKGPAFEVTDGKHAGKIYRKGIEYAEIPEGMGHRFHKVSVITKPQTKVKKDELGQSKA